MKKYLGILGFTVAAAFGLHAFANTPYPPWLQKLSGDVTVDDNGSVQLAAGTIASADLAASAVATTNIAAGAVTEAKLDPLSGAAGNLNVPRVATFIYDTGGLPLTLGAIGAHLTGVSLPAKAVILQSWYKIITQFSDAGAGTVALHCEDANNILTAGDITGIAANTITTGASTGSAATMVRAIGSACEITATVAGIAQDTGKLIGYVEYVVEN